MKLINKELPSPLKTLTGNIILYTIANCISRAVPFLLIPVYVIYLGTEGYGLLTIINMFQTLFTMIIMYTFGITIIRFYHHFDNEEKRMRFWGELWLFQTVQMLIIVLIFECWGSAIFDTLLQKVPYDPYGRYVNWISFLVIVFSNIPINLFKARQQAARYTGLILTSSALQIGFILYFVVVLKEGVLGVLKGRLFETCLMGFLYIFILLHNIKIYWSWKEIRQVVMFSLPLVPELLGFWALIMSDRIILNNHVSFSDLGIYALGYQFGLIVNVIVNSIDNSWLPYFLSLIRSESLDKHEQIPELVSYIFGGLVFTGLSLVLLAEPLIKMMTSQDFYPAIKIAPWIVGGYVFLGFTLIPRSLLIFQKKTRHMALATIVGALINIGLNLILVPKWGISVAAVNTFISYAIVFGIMQWLSRESNISLYNKYDLIKLLLLIMFLYPLGSSIKTTLPWIELILRSIWILCGCFIWLRTMGVTLEMNTL